MASKQENVKEVFEWITGILRKLEIPYHVVGGLAAIAYGAHRPVYDIDIDIEEANFGKLAEAVNPYLTFGPGNFRDPKWDLTMMTIRYRDVDIDISGVNSGKILDQQSGKWVPYESSLKNTEQKELFGSIEPVISREILIRYKQMLARPTDLEDINAITNHV